MNQWPTHLPGTTSASAIEPQPWHDARFRHGIVVGYSGSPASERALAYASGIARRAGTGLVAVQVTPQIPLADWWHGGEALTFTDLPEESNDGLTDTLARTGQLTQVSWVAVHTRGDICHELEQISRQCAADAIVVGASHRITARLLGCVGSRLTQHPRRPVIVIP
ncbi:universal stress protein [Streptomyces sp. M3]|uniref:universal stress protein n=1 Tax=Streptomyces sp. M3 TaxID=295102 RepID=UPI00100F5AD2|nr:universal stress protein [Streptomyces sp. M3]